ncbi:MAG TPA: division/cell wall cluster transcriptional repressor MraZ [Myxococcota bacterium]|nr:division/cell wall cluster transcriptional repressor MraZ [Myxococcota bacterium]HQK49618.1 division/cell wall cluster transcriptional repressor MraZ [Myxococcota bacterium]
MPADHHDLFGIYEGRVDLNTGRLALSSDFESLKVKQVRVGIEPRRRYLQLRLLDSFEEFQNRIRRKADTLGPEDALFLRTLYLGSFGLTQVDSSYRVVLPKKARELLQGSPEVVIVGVGDELQIWPLASWERNQEEAQKRLQETYEQYATEIYRCAPAAEAQAMSGPVG